MPEEKTTSEGQSTPLQNLESVFAPMPVVEPTTPAEPTSTPAPKEGAVVPAKEGAVKPEGDGGTTPPPRTYSTEEWNKRQSSIDTQMSDLGKKFDELQEKHSELLSQGEEQKIASWLRTVEDSEDAALISTAKTVAEGQREVSRLRREIEVRERDMSRRDQLANQALKDAAVDTLVKRHELGEGAKEELSKHNNPVEMENAALKLYIEKASAAQVLPAKVDGGRGSAPVKQIGEMLPTQALGFLIEQDQESRRSK